MKKLLKSANKKIVAILLVIMLLLSTVAIYNIYATIANEEESRGSEADKVGDKGKYITLEDLKKMYDILCCYHGGADAHLTEEGGELSAEGRTTTTTDSGKEIGKLVKTDEGKQSALSEESASATSPFKKSSYEAETYCYYNVSSTEIARPKEAYILAEMIEEVDGGTVFYDDEYSAIQYAWWTTIAGSHGEVKPPENTLAKEAAAFETYIASIAESTDPKDFVEQHYRFEKDGKVFEGEVPAPVITYKPSYDKDVNRDGKVDLDEAGRPTGGDKVTTTWDSNTQTWTVGPFMIDYVESSFSAGDRPNVDFSAITNAELSTNLGKVNKENWKFNWIEGERDKEDKYEFPHQNELFYIELDYLEGATEITNLHFDFKYMNAGGKFDYLKGTYFKETWTPASKVIENCPGPTGDNTTCSHGKKSSHPIKWKYWLKLTGMEQNTSQLLAYGIIGARWYEKEELDLDTTPLVHEGSFKIVKKIVDENGNELTNIDKNKKFKFEITKDGEYYSTEWVSVNKPYVSGTFRWNEGETAPQFSVREILTEKDKKEYTQRGAINVAGSLENSSLTFTAENTPTIHEGYVSITKSQLGKGLENMEFNFKLYIDSKVYVEDGKTAEDGTITLKVGETWTSNAITWVGNNAPKYRVAEFNLPDGVRLVRILNKSGVVQEGKNRTANVVAINRGGPVPYSITLKKELTENIQTDDTFKFKVRVDSQIFVRTLKANESWTETFYRNAGDPAPEYEVEEINVPDDWEQVDIENKSGTLTPNGTVNVRAVNAPKEKSAEIDITKHTISNNQTDDTFTIVCEISGTFKIGDEEIVDGTKTITTKLKAEETKSLGTVRWKGNAPTYKVTETEIPANWKFVGIENESGQFENGKKVTVLCTNSSTVIHQGLVSIEKKQEGTGLENQIFDFKLTVGNEVYVKEGKTDSDGTIHVKVGDIWTSDAITWSGDTAPQYKVEEINIPADVELVGGKVENGTGSLIDGKTVETIATNRKKKGWVSIEKQQVGTGLDGREFSFKLYIKENNQEKLYIKNGITDNDGTIHIKVGDIWTSDEIVWKGNNAPTYKVEEINIPAGVELVGGKVINGTGSLIANGIVKAIAKNAPTGKEYEHATITINKTVTNNLKTNEKFTFTIKVGNDTYTKSLKAGESWSETFNWEKGKPAPDYEVTEINIPAGWRQVKISDNYKGTLKANANIKVTAENGPDSVDGRFQIYKEIVDKNGKKLSNVDANKEFTFEIYKDGALYKTVTVTPSTPYSEDVTWKVEENAPKFEVKEVLSENSEYKQYGEIKVTGKLEDKTLKFTAQNYKDKEVDGGFQIYKEIVDKDGKKLSNVDLNKEFTFEISKDGTLYKTVTVTPNKPYSEDVTWKVGETAPKFEVKEVLKENSEYKQYGEISAEGSLENKTLKFTAKNYKDETEHKGWISIEKQQVGTGLEGREFNFKLTIDNKVYVESGKTADDGTITLKVGETWKSNEITWKGDKAPTYKVEEINIPKDVELVGGKVQNGTGSLIENETVQTIAKNQPKIQKATIVLKKELTANASSDDTFTFTVKVGEDTYTKCLKAGESWTETFVWGYGKPAPEYEVTEIDIPEEWNLVEIKNAKGTLSADETVSITAINEPKNEKSANIRIHKETVTDDKEGVDENDNVYTFVTRISGTFEMEGESIVNGTKTITTTLKKGETVTLDKVKWKGDKAPTYTVAETEIPDGWKLQSITNSSGEFEDGKTIEVNCINEFRIREAYELTMEMSGKVWEDVALKPEDKNTEDSKPNGKYDAGAEEGIENVEVVIWKKFYDASGNEIVGLRKVATGYEEGTNTTIDFPLYTSPDGVWQAPKMEVPGLSDSDKAAGAVKADYDVEFTYDGQTYRPTDFLVSGSAEHFRKATNKQKSQYLNDSMAYEVEAERQDFDSKFETITGDLSIDDNGITEGYSVGTDGNKTDLLYYSTDSMPTVEGNTRKVSELQTLDEGYIREQYKMKSRTSTGGLTYPFDDKVHLVNVSKDIDKIEGGLIIRYHYSATYPYLLNVNLGLVKRDEAELALTKDVYSATVAVNQKLLNYKYNEYVDFESEEYKDYLDLQLKVTDASIAYKLDLYESDYYYRAKVYEANSELQGALEDFYKTLNKTDLSDELDLDVFLTYKISIYNQSENYRAKVKSVVDYFDEDLELVDSNITKYVQEADGKFVDSETVVATPAYVVQKGKTDTSTWGEKLRETIQGKVTVEEGKYTSTQDINTELANNSSLETSNNVKTEDTKSYYKANIDLKDVNYLLDGGEKLELYLTFKVRTDEAPTKFEGNTVSDAVNSYVRLGTKANVAEIASYTTYYGPKDDSDKLIVAGKVDKDSAPNNVDIENKNEKSWYEDDTDSAPIITLDLYNETREISGFAWEDAQTEKIDYNQFVGNGLYNPEEGDQLIGNITTMLVEKVTVKQADGTYKDYDFVWPTNQEFNFLNNQTLEEIIGFDSITLTSNSPEDTGTYQFTNIPAGNYIVRVEYGNFPADALDDNGNTVKLEGASEAKTSDGVPAVYNGQDFKTTAYQADIKNDTGKSDYATNEQGYIDNNEWYDFTTVQYDENGNVVTHNSDVIDNEARRLDVIAYSKVLDNEVTTVLASANKYDTDHTKLYKNTYMFADTAKINLNIENMNSLKGQKVVVTDELTGQSKEVLAGDTETRNNLLTNTVIGKSDINGAKGTISLIDYNYKIEAVDAGLEERSNTEFVLDKEIESITLTTNSGEQILKAVYNIAYKFTLNEETGKSTYEAVVELNDKESYGTSNLIAQNKIEDKDNKEGQQNFRYIYYDDAISQSLNLEVVYRFTVLNLGEVDRTGKVADLATKEEIQAVADKLKDQIYEKDATGKLVRTHKALEEYTGEAYKGIGEYLGSIYYLGKRGSYSQPDKIVTTKARQLIDYVDNDAVFKAADNAGVDASWKSVTADELVANKVIDTSIIQEVDGKNTILDDKGVTYTTTQRTNLALSVDEVSGDKLANPGFIVELVPFAASKENVDTNSTSCQAAMKMVITRSIDSQIDEEDLSYDNIAELVKLENAVGKRDIKTIAGNVNPAKMVLDDGTVLEGEFAASLAERDTSATELITFTPPTGLGVQTSLTIEILIVGLAALAILGTGIVLIKKYVIK